MNKITHDIQKFSDGFSYQENVLTCSGVSLLEIVQQLSTPLFVYNLDAIAERFFEWKNALADFPNKICYAVKANSTLAVLQHLVNQGCSFDVNSRGELFRAVRVGARSQNITMTGVGKTVEDIEAALKAHILFLNVESFEECMLIQSIADQMQTIVQVVLRLNPEVDVKTHPYIATGLTEHKFGLCAYDARDIIPKIVAMKNIRLVGFGMHIGSQIFDSSPFREALEKMLHFIDEVRPILNEPISFINLGGGIGVAYSKNEMTISIKDFVNDLRQLLQRANTTIVVEPGRHIVANAGVLLTKVLYVKRTKTKTFVIVDAGMNDLIRPTLYEAHHEIQPLVYDEQRSMMSADIVGPVCETGDYFALRRSIPEVHEGEYLVIFSSGAYGSTMSSRYNSRPFSAEIVIRNDKYFVARERESLEEMVRLERLIEKT